MNALRYLRSALSELKVDDKALEKVSSALNRVEMQLLDGAASVVRLQSLQQIAEVRFLKADGCPFCGRTLHHGPRCYLNASTGWDLLAEHEATVHENDDLRAALAKYLPHNGKAIAQGGAYLSLKDRARMHPN